MKPTIIDHLMFGLPFLILSTSILSAFCMIAFCMRSPTIGFSLVCISIFGWSGIITAFSKFYDNLIKVVFSNKIPMLAAVWFSLAFLVSLSFGDKMSLWNIILFCISVVVSLSMPCLIFKYAAES